ncbi:MAG: hypothetical protein RIC03_07000 [Cyclobacteriaceae bacterium]
MINKIDDIDLSNFGITGLTVKDQLSLAVIGDNNQTTYQVEAFNEAKSRELARLTFTGIIKNVSYQDFRVKIMQLYQYCISDNLRVLSDEYRNYKVFIADGVKVNQLVLHSNSVIATIDFKAYLVSISDFKPSELIVTAR